MLKKLTIVTVVVVVLGLFVFGWTKTWSYMKGAQQVLAEQIDERAPLRLESARISALIAREREAVLAYEDRICDLEARRDTTARSVEEFRKKLQAELGLLEKIRALLDQDRSHYTIGRASYTYAEVNADALERVDVVRRMEEEIAFRQELVDDLDKAVRQGRGSLAEATRRLVDINGAMERLQARNANAEVRLQVARLTGAIAGAPLSQDSQLEKAIHNYERRVGAKERRALSHPTGGEGAFRIDYSSSVVTRNASAAIGRLLEDHAVEPPAGQALPKHPAADALPGPERD